MGPDLESTRPLSSNVHYTVLVVDAAEKSIPSPLAIVKATPHCEITGNQDNL